LFLFGMTLYDGSQPLAWRGFPLWKFWQPKYGRRDITQPRMPFLESAVPLFVLLLSRNVHLCWRLDVSCCLWLSWLLVLSTSYPRQWVKAWACIAAIAEGKAHAPSSSFFFITTIT
jgi:hypothetical protein